MDNIKVSVVIPVYNVEPYLRECLDSVINQTLKEIEIICIDDRSTDNSYQILEEYAKKDNRIILLKNENNVGVGITRNIGIKNSKGKYLYFMDADDYLSLDYIEQLYITAEKYDSDMVSNLNILKIENDKISYYLLYSEKIISENILEGESTISILNQKYGEKEYPFVTVWNHLLKREFITNNELFFMEIKARWGDADFYYRFMLNNPKTSYNHKSIYYHRINPNSIVQTSKNNLENNVQAIKHLYNSINYCKQKNNDLLLRHIYKICWRDINGLFNLSGNNPLFYEHLYEFANSIFLDKSITYENLYNQYLLIINNNTYEKYLLTKELFNKIDELDKKINNALSKRKKKIKIFGIERLYDRKIIYIFGIRITLKK
ncbi:glycosyltransferase family 2 protein [Brachyspira sp. SAP_772]|uniref:glycosyltransferase n=1 Tax=Brachyspira sp. SAP_772 TaxID=2608385 RepID=UPI0012F48721|nr:glycosyltransferase family 2 protein [Brachyspira sp. SAP_772]